MRKRPPDFQAAPAEKRLVPTPVDELSDRLRLEISRCAARAAEQSEILRSIGDHSVILTCDILRDSTAEDLLRQSHAIRGLVSYSLCVLAELQCVAGRLDALAALRAASPQPGDGAIE